MKAILTANPIQLQAVSSHPASLYQPLQLPTTATVWDDKQQDDFQRYLIANGYTNSYFVDKADAIYQLLQQTGFITETTNTQGHATLAITLPPTLPSKGWFSRPLNWLTKTLSDHEFSLNSSDQPKGQLHDRFKQHALDLIRLHYIDFEIEQQRSVFLSQLDTKRKANITLLTLSGSPREMGLDYGKQLRKELANTLAILKDFFVTQNKIPYTALIAAAHQFNARYSYSFYNFLLGMAEGADLSIDDCMVLNGMETLNTLIAQHPVAQCAFVFIPPQHSTSGKAIIARNYDFSSPFDLIASNLVITVIAESNKIPVAIIGMPGQIYCPSCVNANGLFMELNNGMPSGGFAIDFQRKSMLIQMLEFLQQANDYNYLQAMMLATQSDYSLIINTADHEQTRSFEYSATLGLKVYFPEKGTSFVSTNYFLNSTWQDIPIPSDANTWMGVTRRNNLFTQANSSTTHTVKTVQSLMSKTIEQGGALWPLTIYQIILATDSMTLYVRSMQNPAQWQSFNLDKYFQQASRVNNSSAANHQVTDGAIGAAVGIAVTVTAIGLFQARKHCRRHTQYQPLATEAEPMALG